MKELFESACNFIYRNARPLDLARWQFHFEGGSKDTVLKALSAYQNIDGGFGQALEPDAWNPNSSPIQTWAAIEVLREIHFTDSAHPLVQGVLRYLSEGQDFNGHFWLTVINSNKDYPHAPWWHGDSDSSSHTNYNPTASLAGFIVRFANKESELYALGCRIAQDAVASLLDADDEKDMHTLGCYISLMEYCVEADVTNLFNLDLYRGKLVQFVNRNITRDVSQWETAYVCKPSQFLKSRSSIFYEGNEEIAQYECDFIRRTQLPDGSWNIPWSWAEYPEEWAISKNWWKSNVVILNLLYLNGIAVHSS